MVLSTREDSLRAASVCWCPLLGDVPRAAPEARAGLSDRRPNGMALDKLPASPSRSVVSRAAW